MRKIMRKKVNVFGKTVPVFVLVLLGIGLVSAALVPYLSGLVIGIVTVNQPLELTTDGTAVSWNVPPVDAFDPITQNFVLKNNAGTDIYAIVETSITGNNSPESHFSDDVDFGEEFEYFDIGIEMPDAAKPSCTSDGGSIEEAGTSGNFYCYWDASYDRSFTGVDSGVYYVQMGDGTTPIGPTGIMNGRMKLQFKINVAPALYTFETRALTVEGATDLELI